LGAVKYGLPDGGFFTLLRCAPLIVLALNALLIPFSKALSLGRPPSIQLAHVDIKPPTCIGPGLYVPREEIVCTSAALARSSFFYFHSCEREIGTDGISPDHEWKNAFFIQCLTPMLEAMVAVAQPVYAHILHLDTAVRDFSVPALLDEHQPHDAAHPRFLVMQRGLVTMSREIGAWASPFIGPFSCSLFFFGRN
jgi:hypothetical protein